MSVWQQKTPKSGSQSSLSGGPVLAGRKHSGAGPNCAPLLNSVRGQAVQPGASCTALLGRPLESSSWSSLGSAWVELLELRNVSVMLTTPESVFTSVTH